MSGKPTGKHLLLATTMIVAVLAAPASAQTPAASPAAPVVAPAGAPNVVVVLLDDVGFAASGTFGGPVDTPNLDALARDGLRYNRFHTTAMCSPTRASLMTGRNPHAVNMGTLADSPDPRPGYTTVMAQDAAPLPEILRRNGYATAMFGKWHQTPQWELSSAGPFDRWPTSQGFEKFYGFHGGETDQYEPNLFDGTTPVMRPAGKDYMLTADLVTHSIDWIRNERSLTPNKPFFLYLATGATHAPLQAPAAWIDRYRGKFDQGWDAIRPQILAREKVLGVVPKNTDLTPRVPELPAWESLSAEDKHIASRLMETYAGFLAYTDDQIGRLVAELKRSGQFDNTLFIYIVGDNGASADGDIEGSISYMGRVQGLGESRAEILRRLPELGSATTYPHYSSAWAWALDTPFQWTKKVASHFGGTRNPMIISWPKVITDKGGLRSQFGHVNDIMPTILEAAKIASPTELDGIQQRKIDGTSLTYSFASAKAPERHTTQYFEIYGHRAIYHDGWIASAFHTLLPWHGSRPDHPFEQDKWELYDLSSDFSQAHDLAEREPAKLAELKQLFDHEAEANQVLPLKTNFYGGSMPKLLDGTRTNYFYPGAWVAHQQMRFLAERSWSLDAQVDAGGDARGVLAALGGGQAGWSLYLDGEGRPTFEYRSFTVDRIKLAGAPLARSGLHKIRVEFAYDNDGSATKGATARLLVDGMRQGEAHLSATVGTYSLSERFDVGSDSGTPAGMYPTGGDLGYPFKNGKIDAVSISPRD